MTARQVKTIIKVIRGLSNSEIDEAKPVAAYVGFTQKVLCGLEKQFAAYKARKQKEEDAKKSPIPVDADNYHAGTEGKFRSAPAGWTTVLTSRGIDSPVSVGGRIWSLKHLVDFDGVYDAHWISDDGQHLIRVSNLWSFFSKKVHKQTGVKKRKLEDRVWSMRQKPHPVVIHDSNGGELTVAGGYIRFSDMRKEQ